MANQLSPIVRIGKHGLEGKIVSSINEAFSSRELIKIKILDSAPVKAEEVADVAVKECKASLVRIVGRVIVLYRAFSEKPKKIELPPAKK